MNGNDNIKSSNKIGCQHLNDIVAHPPFLHADSGKTTWICLKDGCFKSKRNLCHTELTSLTAKIASKHSVMINCDSLEIFCVYCQAEIGDLTEEEKKSSPKKRATLFDPSRYRQLLVHKNYNERIIFGGDTYYPPSFQKYKRGLCGLKNQSLTSELNSVVQLLANLTPFVEILISVDLQKIRISPFRILSVVLRAIWYGKYRIYLTDDLSNEIQYYAHYFQSYRNRTPQFLLHEIFLWINEEFSFTEHKCEQGQQLDAYYDEWIDSIDYQCYSPLRELFAGEYCHERICDECGERELNKNKFYCLKLSYAGLQHDSEHPASLVQLIEESFKEKLQNTSAKQNIDLKCRKCNKDVIFSTYVSMPNNLLIYFGDESDGLSVDLPDKIDFGQFTKSSSKNIPKTHEYVVYEYSGSISRYCKRYFTHVRKNGKEYRFQDETISENSPRSKKVKIALYKCQERIQNQSLAKNILSSIDLYVDPVVPLPDFWDIYLSCNYHVQPLMNPFICCHGNINFSVQLSKVEKGPKRVPVEIYRYLIEKFGGRIIAQVPEEGCAICYKRLTLIEEVKQSEKELAIFADRFSNRKEKVLISIEWLYSWRSFLYYYTTENYRTQGNSRPGPINNRILDEQWKLVLPAYKKIAPYVWYFLKKFYGGGPLVTSQHTYKPNSAVVASVDLRYYTLSGQLVALSGKYSKYGKYTAETMEQIAETVEQIDPPTT